jgi:curved DNA-binding protein CbpA
LDSRNPTTDAKEIKRAYRKRAMQYHPDVILGPDSTDLERDEASKNFARINAAYDLLTGGGKGASVGTGTKSSTYQPPHRRQSSYSSSSSTEKSTNWEDFMPKYDEEDAKYDAGGDSFGSILSDLLTGAAGYAAGVAGRSGGGSVVGDFIDFLERNIDGFESGYDDDKSLSQLLLYGSFDDVASEMDETDVLVTSLETKLNTVENELMDSQADLNAAIKFSEKLAIEERIAELKAREKVVKGYLKKGKTRLIRLRERYKELMVEGRGGRGYGSSASSGNAYSESRRPRSDNQAREPAQSSTSSSSTSTSSTPPSSFAKSWRNEGFTGSYGGRSSGSRRRQDERANSDETTAAPASSSTKSWRDEGFSGSYGRRSTGGARHRNDESVGEASTNTEQQQYQPQQQSGSENVSDLSTPGSSNKPTPRQNESWVPPHRRSQSSAERANQDKKRLRELKVDDDFEKLKREMGL